MKRKILLLMMTALLSVGAWAQCINHFWTGSQTMSSYVSPLKLETSSLSLSVGDILSFTISNVTDTSYGLRVCAHKAGNAYWYGDVVKSVSATEDGVVKMVIDNDIITAAATELWINGNFTLTSIDVEKAAVVNLYTNAEGNGMNYWSMRLSSPNLLYAKTGDVLRVTLSAVGSNKNHRKLILQDAEGGEDAGNTLYTCENTSLTAGTLDIRLTDELIAKAQAGSLYIGGYEYTFTAVDLYLTSPTVSIGSAGYATLGYAAALDLTGIDAYTVSVSGTTATLTSIKGKKIPAGTGIILEGSGDVTISLTTEATDDITGNELLVSDGTVTGDGSTIYVLANGSKGVGFYLLQNGDKLAAGKAYLEVSGGAASSRQFIGFGDNVTSIDNIEHSTPHIEQYFDLQGRRVAQPAKGLYIVNGKKVIIK